MGSVMMNRQDNRAAAVSAVAGPGQPPYATAISVAGPRVINEDAVTIVSPSPVLAFYAVADGIGGKADGRLAAQTAVYAASEAFTAAIEAGGDAAAALAVAMQAANVEVRQLGERAGGQEAGCAFVAAAVQGDELTIAHAGDARAYLLQDQTLRQLTTDHTWVQQQVERGLIEPADATRHDLRHILLRAVGLAAELDATFLGPLSLKPGCRLLLCSDGLHDVVEPGEMARLLGRGSAGAAARALVAAALAGGTADNVTALVADALHFRLEAGEVVKQPDWADVYGKGNPETAGGSRPRIEEWAE